MSNRSIRQLGGKQAVILRGGQAVMVPSATATRAELAAGGVEDIEGLCARVSRTFLTARGAYVTEEDRQDMVAYLIGEAWREAERYDPAPRNGHDTPGTLGQYVSSRLGWRCGDWYRKRFGRKPDHRSDRVTVVSLEDDIVVRNMLDTEEAPDEVHEIEDRADAERLLGIDLERLSKAAILTMLHVALPMSKGDTLPMLAGRLGKSRKRLEADLDALAVEITAVATGEAA